MAPPPIAAQRQPSPNRLTIAHLLLWTATTAAVLAGTQRTWHSHLPLMSPDFVQPDDPVPESLSPFRRMQRLESRLSSLALAFAPAYGAALAGLALAGWRLAGRRGGFPVQPGHWLLLAVASVIVAAAWPLAASPVPMVADVPLALRFALPGGVLLVAAWRLPASDWRISFDEVGGGLVGIGLAIQLEGWLSGTGFGPVVAIPVGVIPAILVVLGMITAGLAVAEEVQSRARRDLFHWAGLAVWLMMMLHFVLGLIVHTLW